MSVAEHNPSRGALLGAAVALPLIGPSLPSSFPRRRESTFPATSERWTPDQVWGDDRWDRALEAYRAAEAALAEVERRTAGAPWEEQDAVEEEYGERLDALHGALRLLLRAPAPGLPALALKIELAIDHEVATLNGGEACLETVRRDVRRFAAQQ